MQPHVEAGAIDKGGAVRILQKVRSDGINNKAQR